jgi:hypothetical protein
MPDSNRSTEPEKEKRGGDMKMPPRAFLIWFGVIAVVAIIALARNGGEPTVEELASFPDLQNKITNNLIVPGSGGDLWGAIDGYRARHRQVLRQGQERPDPFQIGNSFDRTNVE